MQRLAAAIMLVLVLTGTAPGSSLDGTAWKDVLGGIDRDIDRRAEEVEAVRRALPGLTAEAQADLAQIDNQFTRVIVLRGVAGSTPWGMRTLWAHYQGLERVLDAKSQKLRLARQYLDRVSQENNTIRAIRRKAPGNAPDNATTEALEAPGRKLEAIKREREGLQAAIDATLAQFDGLRHTLDQARLDFRQDYITVFKAHFFERTHAPLDRYGLILLENRAGEWAEDFPGFIMAVLAWTDWRALVLAGIPAWFFLWLAGRWAARRIGVGGERRVRLGWPLLAFGLALYVTTLETPFTASHALNLALVAVAALGATILVRHHQKTGELNFYLGLYALGGLAQVLDLPAEMVCVAWATVMALAAWSRWRIRRRAALGLAALAIASLAGFGPQALVGLQAWFLFRLAVATTRSLRALLAERGGVWLGYIHPLAVTVLAVAYLGWLLLFMGGPGFVDYVFTQELALGSARMSLDALAAMAVLFFAARLALAWLSAFLERVSFSGKHLDQALSHTISTLASYATWLAFMLAALHILGLPLTGLAWIASGLSVGVGFGLKDIINNFVSGLIILFGGSIKKGDVVQTGKTLGEVTAVSVRNTTVRTMDNSMVIIPNSSFLKGEIINWSYQDKRIRLTIPVSVAPGTKVKKVRKILLGAAAAHEQVLKNPAPSVFMRPFGRYGLEFDLYVWIEDFRDKFRVESDLASSIDRELQEAKIIVAFQGVKVKYKPRGSEEAQLLAAREALKEKRRQVFSLVRPLRSVHMRAKWGVAAGTPSKED